MLKDSNNKRKEKGQVSKAIGKTEQKKRGQGNEIEEKVGTKGWRERRARPE